MAWRSEIAWNSRCARAMMCVVSASMASVVASSSATAEVSNERSEPADKGNPNQNPNNVENKMCNRGALRVPWFPYRREECRHRGADVGAKHESNTSLGRDQALTCEHDHDSRRSG